MSLPTKNTTYISSSLVFPKCAIRSSTQSMDGIIASLYTLWSKSKEHRRIPHILEICKYIMWNLKTCRFHQRKLSEYGLSRKFKWLSELITGNKNYSNAGSFFNAKIKALSNKKIGKIWIRNAKELPKSLREKVMENILELWALC